MIITIDLKRQPEVADLIADMNMGDGVCFKTSLKSRNDTMAEFTLDKAEECDPPEMDDENANEDASENGEEPSDESGSRNTPGGSVEQDKMAANVAAQL